MSRHLVPLEAGGWSLWRWVLLRGAGFAASDVRELGPEARELGPEAPDDEAALVSAERARIGERLRAHARAPRFREALTWQNRSVLHDAVDRLLETPPGTANYKARVRQRAIASYLQRYAVKNDSIGFFGPVAWGVLDDTAEGFTARPGPALLDARAVAFEDWAIEALAAQLARDPALRPAFRPRRRPSSWLDGDVLYGPPAAPRHLTPIERFLVAAADGARTARQLAEAAAAEPACGLTSPEAALSELEKLARENVLTWGLELPTELEHPERWLREALELVEDPEARAKALAPLDRLEAARARVAAAAGDPAALDARIEELEQTFREATQLSEKRGHGQTYAGRRIFVEECRRSFELRIGRPVLAELAAPLSLVLDSARWFTHEIARGYRRALDDVYRKLRGDAGPRVPLATLLAASRGLFSSSQYEAPPIVREVAAELQRRWAEVLALPPAASGEREREREPALQLSSAACRARAAALFEAPGPGWPRARYHCPDLLIAAASAADIERGRYLGVLGEVHPGVNTLFTHAAFRLHPDRAALCDAYDADMGMVCIAPAQTGVNRVMHAPLSPHHLHVELGAIRSWRPRSQVHLAGDLYIEEEADRLRVRSRRAPLDYDIIAFLEQLLGAEAMSHFKLLPRRPHTPRISIDKLVLARERWHLEPAAFRELLEPAAETDAERVRRVTAWTRRLGLPRYVFGTVPHEPKPFYVDFASPIYVELFVRYLASATALGLSEMLPGYDQLWLSDADGHRYTSELRLAAVDPRRWAPPGAPAAAQRA